MRWVLFLCSGNHYRSRFAEEAFNYHARVRGLDYRADSRGLVRNLRALGNAGKISVNTVRELRKRGITPNKVHRPPMSVCTRDCTEACVIIALYQKEHQPLIRAEAITQTVRYWDIPDIDEMEAPEALQRCYDKVLQLLVDLDAPSTDTL